MVRQYFLMKTAILIIFCIPLIAGSKVISESQYGKNWPFTVKSGTLECLNGNIVVFHANGQTYAINGSADGVAGSRGYKDLREIWRNNPEYDKYFSKNDPDHPKINIGPIIKEGLQLCR